MANVKSAEKRARQNDKRRERNSALRTQAKTETKKALAAIEKAGSLADGLKALSEGEKALRKAATKGVIPAERASRKISRMAAVLNKKFKKPAAGAAKTK